MMTSKVTTRKHPRLIITLLVWDRELEKWGITEHSLEHSLQGHPSMREMEAKPSSPGLKSAISFLGRKASGYCGRHQYNHVTCEAKAEEMQVQYQLGSHSKTLSQGLKDAGETIFLFSGYFICYSRGGIIIMGKWPPRRYSLLSTYSWRK